MKASDRAITNAKWYCTNGMILTVLSNVVENQSISLFTAICALLQFLMVAFEIGNYKRFKAIEEYENKEFKKRINKLVEEIEGVNSEFDKIINKSKNSKKKD